MNDIGAVSALVERLEQQILPEVKNDPQFYRWVPLPLGEFLSGMQVVTQALIEERKCFDAPTFLDAGCGIGSKMFLAQALGYQVAGIEREPAYAAAAICSGVHIADATEWDGYGAYDVVYSYRLCVEEEQQSQLEKHIISNLKPGALFFCAGRKLDGDHIGDQVWRF
jgi:SAM-dependent methyltransferase